ncbi:MAG: carboxymuconolactone decarboxylase family protein [Pseudomonadota bacterium]
MAAEKTSLYEQGLAVRRQVLGSDYVDQSLASATEFNQSLQDFVTEHCWGAIWTRPGLELKTRSMLNIAMLTVLNRPHELKLHVKGALRNGVTREEISEILLQSAAYSGAPASIDGFKVAAEVIANYDRENAPPAA